jgi:hypothetical protein
MKLRFNILILLLGVMVQPVRSQQAATPLTKDQVMDLVTAGMETPKLAKLIQDHGIDFDLTDDYLQPLSKAGAEEPVIQALRAARPKPLSREEVLKLVAGGVPSPRAAALVKQHGVDFVADEKFLQTVRLAGGDDSVIDSLREASASAMGELLVTTSPKAEVYLDGESQGQASAQGELVLKVTPGIHALKVTLTGKKDFQQNVTLSLRQTTKLEARLEDIPVPVPAPVEPQDPAYLGVGMRALDDVLAKQWKVPNTVGVLVVSVSQGGPADKAGIKMGDVVRKLNGQPVQNPQQLTDMVAQQHPGAEAPLEILRGGQLIEVNVTFAKRPAGCAALSITEGALRGVGVQKLTPALRAQWSVPSNVEGMLVSQIDAQSASARVGLQVGDVIEEINRQAVHNLEVLGRVAAELKDQELVLLISHRGTGLFLVITPTESKNGQKP